MSEEQTSVKKAPVKAMWIVMILAWVLFLLPIPGTGIFIAGPLNLAAFILAIVCLTRSRVLQGILGFIGTCVVSGVLFMFGSAATVGVALHDIDKQASKQTEKANDADVIKVSARDMIKAYDANEVSADGMFKGKIVEVTGRVGSIGKDITDNPYIAIDTGDVIRSVQCFFQKSAESELARVSKGQRITIRGEVDGLMMNVIVRGARIVE
ncbi:MAG: OB-fold putative lipoprotein [Proteobacteria bacterium]|nr:OB-fold putative lipoprotein [Pseudomonadota bacterium]